MRSNVFQRYSVLLILLQRRARLKLNLNETIYISARYTPVRYHKSCKHSTIILH